METRRAPKSGLYVIMLLILAGCGSSEPGGPVGNAGSAASPPTDPLELAIYSLNHAELKTQVNGAMMLKDMQVNAARRNEIAALLQTKLESKDESLAGAAALALMTWGGPDNVSALVSRMKDSHQTARWRYFKALAKIGNEAAINALAERLPLAEDFNSLLPELKSCGAKAEPAVLPLLKQDSNRARTHAIKALESVGTAKALVDLAPFCEDADEDSALASDAVRSAEQIVKRLSAADMVPYLQHLQATLGDAELFDEAAFKEIEDNEERNRAVAAVLETAVREQGSVVTVVALGKWGGPENVPALAAPLTIEGNRRLRESCITALKAIGHESAAGPLAAQLRTELDRSIVMDALVALGAKATDAVSPYLEDDDERVRRAAQQVLDRIGEN